MSHIYCRTVNTTNVLHTSCFQEYRQNVKLLSKNVKKHTCVKKNVKKTHLCHTLSWKVCSVSMKLLSKKESEPLVLVTFMELSLTKKPLVPRIQSYTWRTLKLQHITVISW